jgi:hypothetical protein
MQTNIGNLGCKSAEELKYAKLKPSEPVILERKICE